MSAKILTHHKFDPDKHEHIVLEWFSKKKSNYQLNKSFQQVNLSQDTRLKRLLDGYKLYEIDLEEIYKYKTSTKKEIRNALIVKYLCDGNLYSFYAIIACRDVNIEQLENLKLNKNTSVLDFIKNNPDVDISLIERGFVTTKRTESEDSLIKELKKHPNCGDYIDRRRMKRPKRINK